MPGTKGRAPNSPNRGSKITTRKMKSGPNKGVTMRMREFIGPDGEKHSAPAPKPRKKSK